MQIYSAEGLMSDKEKGLPEPVINIGVLIQSSQTQAASEGAELAIRNINERTGDKGRKFRIVVSSMEGPWGTGSKKAESMVFDDNVFAIIGSHDGRNAHLVEQVVAKTHICYVSAKASDPTLSQAFVPWFFSCVPNDLQQAASLKEEIYYRRNFKKVVVLSDNSYDSNQAVKSFLKMVKEEGLTDPVRYSIENSEKAIKEILNKLRKKDKTECIVLFGNSDFARKTIGLLSFQKMDLPIYCSLFTLNDKVLTDLKSLQSEKLVLVSSGFFLSIKGRVFKEDFKKVYGTEPDEEAAYAYDAAGLIAKAIENANYDPEELKDELVKIHYEGVTGSIRFDDRGNRIGLAGLVEIKAGKPVTVGTR